MWPEMFLLLFVFSTIIHLAGAVLKAARVCYLTKPLLMPFLALYYIASAETINLFMVLALSCGWLGDIFLMIPDPEKTRQYFRPGLVAFLLGHLFYIAVFVPYIRNLSLFPPWGWLLMIFYLATGFFGYRLIGPHAGAMRIPILAYVVIFTIMGASVVFPFGAASLRGVLMAMIGAFVFMISDIVNGFGKFVREIPNERFYSMITYLAGQFLLVQGYLLF